MQAQATPLSLQSIKKIHYRSSEPDAFLVIIIVFNCVMIENDYIIMILNFWLFVSRLKIKNYHMTGNVLPFFFFFSSLKMTNNHVIWATLSLVNSQFKRQDSWIGLNLCRWPGQRVRGVWPELAVQDAGLLQSHWIAAAPLTARGLLPGPQGPWEHRLQQEGQGGLALASLWEAISLCLNSCGFWFCIYFSGGINCSCSFSHRKHK